MGKTGSFVTRRDFLKGAGCAALGLAVGLPSMADVTEAPEETKSRVALVRHKDVVGTDGKISGEIVQQMLDQSVTALFDEKDPVACWKRMIKPDDIVGIKTNVWQNLSTTTEVEQAIKRRVLDAGVSEDKVAIDDRGVLYHPVFKTATALINARPMRTHAWSGVGSLIKNYIMFSPNPSSYHDNACEPLGSLWELPEVKGKTRLNVLVMFTPLFHGRGWHHFDPQYLWTYGGLVVGVDPVAVDSVGLRIMEARRREFFGKETPMNPPAHHIMFADTKYHIGTSDPKRIELIKLGWEEGVLI